MRLQDKQNVYGFSISTFCLFPKSDIPVGICQKQGFQVRKIEKKNVNTDVLLLIVFFLYTFFFHSHHVYRTIAELRLECKKNCKTAMMLQTFNPFHFICYYDFQTTQTSMHLRFNNFLAKKILCNHAFSQKLNKEHKDKMKIHCIKNTRK